MEKFVIVAVVVIVVNSVDVNRKSLDERYVSVLDDLGSRLSHPICL